VLVVSEQDLHGRSGVAASLEQVLRQTSCKRRFSETFVIFVRRVQVGCVRFTFLKNLNIGQVRERKEDAGRTAVVDKFEVEPGTARAEPAAYFARRWIGRARKARSG